ncbi:MAG: NAD-binding protein [Candidatus Methanomethylophilaceae archaeon]|nr:NAD-binding protein [Candidatus Methanomethylophilaceae archaeon]
MRVVIIGAGSVGFVAAETIAGIHDVLVVDSDSMMAEKVKSSLNVSVLHEDGSNPRVLKEAIQKHNAEAVVSTLKDDAVNLFICMMAKRYDRNIFTVASVNHPDYRIDLSSDGVDMIISPEMMTARKIYKMAVMENSTDFEFVDSLGVGVAVYRVKSDSTVVGQVVLHFRLPEECSVIGIYRDGELKLDVDTMEVRVGDGICVFGSEEGLEAFNDFMGVDIKAVQFVILGGSIMGANLAKMLLKDKEKRFVTVVELNEERCRELAKTIPEAMILREDYKDPRVQRSEELFKADCVVVASGSDDTNLLMCMSAERYNSRKVITRYFKPEYKDIFVHTGLETIVSYHRIVSNEITNCVLPNDVALMRMRNRNELFFMHSVGKESKFCDKYLGDLDIPEGIRVVAVYRADAGQERVIYTDLDTYIKEGDQLIVFTNLTRESDFRRLFGKNAIPEL